MRRMRVRLPKKNLQKILVPDMERAHKELEGEEYLDFPEEVVVIYGKEEVTYIRRKNIQES